MRKASDGKKMSWQCVLLFDSQDPEFARGYEAGVVEGRLRALPDEPVTELVHADNAEMMLRIAEATGRSVCSQEKADDWLEVSFRPVQ
jgi:hypothetical protein